MQNRPIKRSNINNYSYKYSCIYTVENGQLLGWLSVILRTSVNPQADECITHIANKSWIGHFQYLFIKKSIDVTKHYTTYESYLYKRRKHVHYSDVHFGIGYWRIIIVRWVSMFLAFVGHLNPEFTSHQPSPRMRKVWFLNPSHDKRKSSKQVVSAPTNAQQQV